MATIDEATLRSFAEELLLAGGFAPDPAAQTARLLVWANMRGADLAWRVENSTLP
ncbi:hypothetical protein [Rhizobium sp. AN83]|uniref:hypothetical protein n=1 Tax=Rhizobium sp. AN83 TaxID=3035217 RepID=UPI002B264493|nr:hypothetical protein [Rhizobium sp. AN83]